MISAGPGAVSPLGPAFVLGPPSLPPVYAVSPCAISFVDELSSSLQDSPMPRDHGLQVVNAPGGIVCGGRRKLPVPYAVLSRKFPLNCGNYRLQSKGMFSAPIRLPANWLLPSLLIAATWAFAPASAEAACGEYVMIGAPGASHSSHVSSRADGSPRGPVDGSQAPARRFPCSGPQCSEGAPRPFGVPVAPVKIVVRHWALLEAASAPMSSGCLYAGIEDDAGASRYAISGVYRPPR